MEKTKYYATVKMRFTSHPKLHHAQRHFDEYMSKAFRLIEIQNVIQESHSDFSPEEKAHVDQYEYVLYLKLYSNKGYKKLSSVVAIFHHWALLWDGSFEIEGFQELPDSKALKDIDPTHGLADPSIEP